MIGGFRGLFAAGLIAALGGLGPTRRRRLIRRPIRHPRILRRRAAHTKKIKATDCDNHSILVNRPGVLTVVIGTSEDSQDAARAAGKVMYPLQGRPDFQLIVVVDLRNSIRRTFAIISHPDAGKTTLTENLLLAGGAIRAAGAVRARGEQRRTRSDWMKIERERGISVSASAMTFDHAGLMFNLLDTPGHEDFSEDTYRTLTAADAR